MAHLATCSFTLATAGCDVKGGATKIFSTWTQPRVTVGLGVATVTFWERLAAARRRAGLTQDQVAALTSKTRQAVSKWERGEAEPSMEDIVLMAQAFGVSVSHLLGEEPNRTDQPTPEEEWPEGLVYIRRAGRELTEEQKRLMLRTIKAFLEEDEQEKK